MAETKLHNYSVQEKLNKMDVDIITITPTINVNEDSGGDGTQDNDVIFDYTEIPNAVAVPGGSAIIQSITLLDKDDLGAAIDLVFADADTDLGTLDAAVSDDDTGAEGILGYTAITSYFDGIAWQVANKNNLGMVVKAVEGSKSIYIAGVNRNGAAITNTAASQIVIKIGIVKD
jgi:hypothetical protein